MVAKDLEPLDQFSTEKQKRRSEERRFDLIAGK